MLQLQVCPEDEPPPAFRQRAEQGRWQDFAAYSIERLALSVDEDVLVAGCADGSLRARFAMHLEA